MTTQQQAAIEAMKEWLSHPAELGMAPSKIVIAGEFDRHEMHYYILKYKKSFFSPWLIGVCGGYEGDSLENCGHIFSEMEPYDAATAQDKAIAMVEHMREYYRKQAEALKDRPEPGPFLGFVLLETPEWDVESFKAALKADWDMNVAPQAEYTRNSDDKSLILFFDVDGIMASAMLVEAPVPDGEAERNAQFNLLSPKEAAEAAHKHTANIIVSVLSGEKYTAKQRGMVFVMIASTLLKMNNALGIYTNGTVLLPDYYLMVTEDMKSGKVFPLLNLIFVGLTRNEKGVSGFTCGLRSFGHEEIEILDSAQAPSEIHDMLLNISGYIVNSGAVLLDGQTLGYSAEQKLSITLSDGFNVSGKSLKIGF